jgi:hypothetical protein
MQEAMRQQEVMSIMMAGEEGEGEERVGEEGMGCHGILSSLHTTDKHQQPPGTSPIYIYIIYIYIQREREREEEEEREREE